MERALTFAFSASDASMASSTAWRLSTGRAPGSPRHTGQTLVLGAAPKPVGHPQKILVWVASWTWTSSPITGSYLAMTSGAASASVLDGMSQLYRPVLASPADRRLHYPCTRQCGLGTFSTNTKFFSYALISAITPADKICKQPAHGSRGSSCQTRRKR